MRKLSIEKYFTWTFLKKNIHVIILIAIILYGFNLRAYHIDYAPIGYHNMKENEYLSEAYHMLTEGSFVKLKVWWYGITEESVWLDQFPFIALGIFMTWKVFGVNVWSARLLIILLSIGNIFLTYLIVKNLTKKEYMALLSAFFMAIFPISVFFGRNIQPETPALFSMLMFIFLFLRWRDDRTTKNWILFCVFFALAAMIKVTNMIGILSVIFLIPPIKTIKKEYKQLIIRNGLIFLFIMSLLPIWIFIQVKYVGSEYGMWYSNDNPALTAFTPSYWGANYGILKRFVLDNFTYAYFYFALIGLFFVILKHTTRFGRFCIGYTIAIFPYFMRLSGHIKNHTYYQMPFLPLVSILSAYFLFVLGNFLSQLINIKQKKYLKFVPLVLILLTIPNINTSTNRLFDTLFYGVDVAGEHINMNSVIDDRVWLGPDSSGQTFAVLWSAKRFGNSIPSTIDEMKQAEQELNFKWVFIYHFSLPVLQGKTEIWDYVSQNYEISQIGLIQNNNQYQPMYFVLKKGGSFNLTQFQVGKNVVPVKTYDNTQGSLQFYTMG